MRAILAGTAAALALLAAGAAAQERIFVDQWSPTESVLFIADADGANPRKLVAGSERDYNASFSVDDEWVVFSLPGASVRFRTFPSFSPDGAEVVYRVWGDTAEGLRIVSLAAGAVRTLTTGYDNFPAWSPRGDLIVFSRLADGDFDIFTIRPDGTDLRQLTTTPGGDSHPAWSPDGEHILFSSSRHGFKDEAPMHDIPQPYGELFIMRADGSEQRALTDNRWEEGTPAWVPAAAEIPAP